MQVTDGGDAPVPLPASSEVLDPYLSGRRVGMVVFSCYPADPRPRRAAEALVKAGMKVDVISEASKDLPKRVVTNNLDITRIPVTHRRGGAISYVYQYSAFTLISAAILAWRSLRHRYDLIYVHNMPDVLVFCALIPKWLGAKVVLDQHDPMPELMMTIFGFKEDSLEVRAIRKLEQMSLWFADFVITVNRTCRNRFAARACPAEKIGIVMNSPDAEIFRYRSARHLVPEVSGKRFVIMYHGSIVERNGLDVAVDALVYLRNQLPGAELRIYGPRTPFLEKAIGKAGSLGLQDSVSYLGPKTLEELAKEIEDCDLGIIPNQRNRFTDINTPTRIFEYLALGKPVIAPRTPGILDYFDSDSLFLFEAGDSRDLAEKIKYVYANPRKAIRAARRGQQVYLTHTWEHERRKLVEMMRQVLIPGCGTYEPQTVPATIQPSANHD